jgi:hypothetical protein
LRAKISRITCVRSSTALEVLLQILLLLGAKRAVHHHCVGLQPMQRVLDEVELTFAEKGGGVDLGAGLDDAVPDFAAERFHEQAQLFQRILNLRVRVLWQLEGKQQGTMPATKQTILFQTPPSNGEP